MDISKKQDDDSNKKRLGKIILAIVVISFGILEAILVYGTIQEIISVDLLNNQTSSDDVIQQELTSKIAYMILNLIFAVISIVYGVKILKRVFSKSKLKGITSGRSSRINSREKKLAYFQTQFGFYILIIAILISFSIQSMNDDRHEWMYVWSILAVFGVFYLARFRDKKLKAIFDDDYYT